MRLFLKGFGAAAACGIAVTALIFFWPQIAVHFGGGGSAAVTDAPVAARQKTKEELIAEAIEKSSKIKALYMTADVASDPGAGAARLRQNIIRIAEETEINGIVIDVKEVCGPDYDEKRIRELLSELKVKGIWSIARVVVFKDASQTAAHPEWYLTRKTPLAVGGECSRKRHLVAKPPISRLPLAGDRLLWQDRRGGYWLDPASEEARRYIVGISKRMIDLGFDELQFDYIRFPSDGDVENAVYPAWDRKTPRHEVLKSFFIFLHDNLKRYKPEVMLSADLFGYVAAQREDLTIGQRLDDIGHFFDYVSFMVYPSHYYGGFTVPADPAQGSAALYYTPAEARAHPDIVVGQSLSFARDFLNQMIASSAAASTQQGTGDMLQQKAIPAAGQPWLRPWLEDFFHEDDRAAGRPWGAQKVRLQIDAAEAVEDHGWLLWNASNVYSEDALKRDGGVHGTGDG